MAVFFRGREMSREVVEVTEEVTVTVALSPAGKQRKARLTACNCCLGCEKEHPPKSQVRRGLCTACYQAVKKAIDRRRFTQTELIREGKLLPKDTPGPRPKTEFAKEMLGK